MSKLFFILALSCALTAPIYSQVATAELSGAVTDSTGAAVANAKVTATNVATNVERSTTTGTAGNYLIPLLPPGDYVLNAEAAGFRKAIQRGITLQINQQAQIDITLQLGQVSESVEVTAQAPLLQSESSSLGTVVNEKLVNQLPLRRFSWDASAALWGAAATVPLLILFFMAMRAFIEGLSQGALKA